MIRCITFLDKQGDMRMGQYHIPFRVGWTSITHRSYPQVVNSHRPIQNSEAVLNIGYILAKHTWNHTFTICFDVTVFSFVNHFPYFRTIGVTWVLFWKFGIVFCLCTLQHFCAAVSIGERLWGWHLDHSESANLYPTAWRCYQTWEVCTLADVWLLYPVLHPQTCQPRFVSMFAIVNSYHPLN